MAVALISILLALVFLGVYWFFLFVVLSPSAIGYFQSSIGYAWGNFVFYVLSFVIWLFLTFVIVFLIPTLIKRCKKRSEYELGHGNERKYSFSYGASNHTNEKVLDTDIYLSNNKNIKSSKSKTANVFDDIPVDTVPVKKPDVEQCEAGPANDKIQTHSKLNVELKDKTNRRSFHEVKMREKPNMRIETDPKRFTTFHSPPENSLSSVTNKEPCLQHAQLSKQDSFLGLPEFKHFNSYLQLVTIDTPVTPMSPREEFFIDLYKAAELEEKRRSLPYQGSIYLEHEHASTSTSPTQKNEQDDGVATVKTRNDSVEHSVQNENSVVKRPRLPSVVEMIEKNGKRLSVRESIVGENNPPGSPAHKDSLDGLHTMPEDDDVFSEEVKSNALEFFVASSPGSPTYTCEAFHNVKN